MESWDKYEYLILASVLIGTPIFIQGITLFTQGEILLSSFMCMGGIVPFVIAVKIQAKAQKS